MLEVYYQTTMKVAIMAAAPALAGGCASAPQEPASLAGTSWQFVKFTGGDGKVLIPDDKSKYTVNFGADGRFNVRFDRNRGNMAGSRQAKTRSSSARWASRARCADPSRCTIISSGSGPTCARTLCATVICIRWMADGGIFEFEPLR